MKCNTCGTTLAVRLRVWFDPNLKKCVEICDICGKVPSVWLPDVYLGGTGGHEQINENLCDPSTYKPIPYSSKREKAAIMRMLKLREAGDPRHGSHNFDPKCKDRDLF